MSRSIVSGDCPVDEAVHALATGFCVGLHGKAFSVLFLLKGFLLFAFYLLDTLFRCRKIFWHCSSEFFYCLANLLADCVMRLICSALPPNFISPQLFFCLCGTEKICGKCSATRFLRNSDRIIEKK